MRFVTYEAGGIERFGLLLGDNRVLDVEGGTAARLARAVPTDRALALARAIAPPEARAFIANGSIALDAARTTLRFAEEALSGGGALTGPHGETIVFGQGQFRLKAPVPRPRKFIAAGKNYFAHQQEMQQRADPNAPRAPIAHVQFASTVIGPDEIVHFPPETKHMDYEVEIGVVIGRPAFAVDRARALDYVFGYTIYNDITDREMYRAAWPGAMHGRRGRRCTAAQSALAGQRRDAAGFELVADDVQDRRADRTLVEDRA
jgi:2-keto-4-pentenoate hydratase/2-oxohepta-3-ene-1,7-dioic acid hydratase in catechol pathway